MNYRHQIRRKKLHPSLKSFCKQTLFSTSCIEDSLVEWNSAARTKRGQHVTMGWIVPQLSHMSKCIHIGSERKNTASHESQVHNLSVFPIQGKRKNECEAQERWSQFLVHIYGNFQSLFECCGRNFIIKLNICGKTPAFLNGDLMKPQ